MSTVVSIHSFRGGTGKSNVTANLATMIANSGKRVGIVDTDIQSPGIHVLFGLDDEKITYTLNDYLWGRCAIEETAHDISSALNIKRRFVGKTGCVYLIPSSIKTNEISRILREGYDARMLNDGFRHLCQHLKLDYLFIDTHPGINEETLLSVIVSHVLIVLLRPDHQDYQGTAVTVDVARKLDVPKMFLVVNKALPKLNFAALRQQVETTYSTTVAGVLPVCDEMFHVASREIFCLRYPEHPWTQEIAAIARTVMQNSSVAKSGMRV